MGTTGSERGPTPPRQRQRLLVLAGVLGLLLSLLPPASPAQAAVFNVNNLGDPSPATGSCPVTCTLRNAITQAAPGDTIQFSVTGTILLTSDLMLTKNVVIQGPGASSLILDGQDTSGVLTVFNAQATISGLTVQRGRYSGITNLGQLSLSNVVVRNNRGDFGGGISSYGVLTITNSTISNNVSNLSDREDPGAGDGGGILVYLGSATIVSTTISDNETRHPDGRGGGIASSGGTLTLISSTVSGNSAPEGAGISSILASLSVTNSTFSGNTAQVRGGGVSVRNSVEDTRTTSLLHTTIVENTAPEGAAFYVAGPMNVRASIIAKNHSGQNCDVRPGYLPMTSGGHNLSDSNSCFTTPAQGDIFGTPNLGPLALNAPGVTKTHALIPFSLGVDGVTDGCAAGIVTDQRGVARPQRWAGDRCDIGAFELEANTAPTIGTIGTQSTSEDSPVPVQLFTVGDAQTPDALTITGSSSNQTLVPDANIGLSGSGIFRSVTVTPAANQSGEATITLTVSDGFATAATAFLIQVSAVNDAPVAVNDTYTINSAQTLNATVGSGVLANDTDIDGPSLAALLEQRPTNGSVILIPNGSFTYQPNPSFAGTDTFTYRLSDGIAPPTSPATVTINVTPTACLPRPVVRSVLAAGGGKLQVRVESTPLAGRAAGPLRELRFGTLQNAKVTVGGQTMASGQVFAVAGSVTGVDFIVERIVAGQPTTVPLTVVDDCGSWPTFVGGGTGAGF